jgi:hypothetical protein
LLALYIIAGIIVFIVLLMCIPVETTISMDTESGKRYSLVMSWMFGLIKKDMGERRLKKAKELKRPGKKKRLLSRFDIDFVSQIINAGGMIKRFKDFITGIYKLIKIKEITGDIVVGLEDPAYTGMLFAVIGPVNALLNLHPRYNVSIRPFFDDENILEGNLYGNVKVQPIRLVSPAIKLAVSREVRQIGKSYLRSKWRKRRKSA